MGVTKVTAKNFQSSTVKKMDFRLLKNAVDGAVVVDAHAHNLVALDSTVPFIDCFSEAHGDASAYVPHSLSFKVFAISPASTFDSSRASVGTRTYSIVFLFRSTAGHPLVCDKVRVYQTKRHSTVNFGHHLRLQDS